MEENEETTMNTVNTVTTNTNGDLRIDCDECVMQHTSTCDECIVTFLCRREPDDAVIIDVGEARAVRALQAAGLVPELRHVPRTG